MLYLKLLLLIGCLGAVTSSKHDRNAPSGIHILDGICLPKRSDRLVYRNQNDTDIYIAFDILKKGKVHVYSWKIIKAVKRTILTDMVETQLPAVDFRKTVDRNHILGACSKAHYKKFRHRLLRKMAQWNKRSCKKREDKKSPKPEKRCHPKITDVISVLVRLKMRDVKFNVDEDEINNCQF